MTALIRSNKWSRAAAACLLTAVAALACADTDTILALNVNVKTNVPRLTKLHVSVVQGGKNVAKDYDMLPTRTEGKAGMESTFTAENFFERIKLDGFSDGKATLDVEAFVDASSYHHPDPVEFDVRENGTTAVFVNIRTPEDRMPAAGGAGGNGGAASGGAASGGAASGGAASGGTTANGGAETGGTAGAGAGGVGGN